jgi:Glyoxalase-like domain
MPGNRSLSRVATLGTALGLLVTLMTVAALAQSDHGRIDHVRILVNDVKTTGRDIYGKRLGFYLPEQGPAIFDEGSAHEGIMLFDHTGLELVGVADADKLRRVRPWIVNFLQAHEGAHSVGLAVDSAEQIADHLASQGIDAPMFRLAPSAGAKPIFLITPRMPHLPEGAIFFIQYTEPWWRCVKKTRKRHVV